MLDAASTRLTLPPSGDRGLKDTTGKSATTEAVTAGDDEKEVSSGEGDLMVDNSECLLQLRERSG